MCSLRIGTLRRVGGKCSGRPMQNTWSDQIKYLSSSLPPEHTLLLLFVLAAGIGRTTRQGLTINVDLSGSCLTPYSCPRPVPVRFYSPPAPGTYSHWDSEINYFRTSESWLHVRCIRIEAGIRCPRRMPLLLRYIFPLRLLQALNPGMNGG